MERAFEYDENLVALCSASSLFNDIQQNSPQQVQLGDEHDRACWDLFVQHGKHFHRPIPPCLAFQQHQDLQQLSLQDDSRILQRFQQFLFSVHLVHEHNNPKLNDSSSLSPSFRLTLNRFADISQHELAPTTSQRTRRLSLRREEWDDQDIDDGDAWFHPSPWEDNAGENSDESDDAPLTRLADWRDVREALHSSWGIGHGSINRLDAPIHHHHRHDLNKQNHHAEKPKDFAVPIDQSAFAQVPFPDDDVAVSKLNGKELAIKQANPAHHSHHYSPANVTSQNNDDDDRNDGKPTTLDWEPPIYLNWATTENPDGVPLVHDVFDQVRLICKNSYDFVAVCG